MLKKLFLDLNNFKSNLGSVERGDSIELNIKLLNDEDYSRSKFRLLGAKSDGKSVEQIEGLNLEDKDLKVVLEDQFVNCEGIVKLELNVVSGETEITTKEFYFFVSNTMNASIIDSADSLPTLEKVSKYVDDAVNNLDALKEASEDIALINGEFKENEIKRKANELLRERSEKERVRLESIRTTEEADRIKAEAERKEAENNRKVAESNRKLAENTRKTNEAARVEAELNRQSLFEENEEIRNSNENLRIASEKERIKFNSEAKTDELNRKEAEKNRVLAEEERKSSEESRVAAEAIRQNTYTDFNDSEAERKNNEIKRQEAEALRVEAETRRDNLFSEKEEERNTSFIESEKVRNAAFNKAQDSRNTVFEESETVREGAFKISEKARNDAEELRVTAESERVKSEKLRVDSEKARVLAEEERNTTFTQKEEERNNTFTQNEEERQGIFEEAENARKVAESKRVAAETGRVEAEKLRVAVENGRVEAENLRVAAEEERVAAELSRVEAENNRSSNIKQIRELLSSGSMKITFHEREGFLTANGSFSSDSSQHCKVTNKIYCEEGWVFSYYGKAEALAVSYIMYKGNTIVKTGQNNSERVNITIPDGVDNIVFSSFNSKERDIILEVELIKPSIIIDNNLKEKLNNSINIAQLNTDLRNVFNYTDKIIGKEDMQKTEGYYANISGTTSKANRYAYYTQNVKAGDIYNYNGTVIYQLAPYHFLDDDDNVIEIGGDLEAHNILTPFNFDFLIIPEGVAKIRLCAGNGGGETDFYFAKKEINSIITKADVDALVDTHTYTDIGNFTEVTEKYNVSKGNYINSNGNAVVDAESECTDFIDISTLDGTLYLDLQAKYQTVGMAIYNSSKSFLAVKGEPSKEHEGVVLWNKEPIDILNLKEEYPTAKFIRFCSYSFRANPLRIYTRKTTLKDIVKQLEEKIDILGKQSNVLYGKKWVACGDSFTEGDFTGFVDEFGQSGKNSSVIYDKEMRCYKTYPWWIAKRNNMQLTNEAICGSTMALSKEYLEGTKDDINYRNPFSLSRYKKVPLDTDYLTLWFGLNETSTPLGTLQDTDNRTILGAWNIVLEYFITNMPYCKIGIVISDGGLRDEFANGIISVAEYWGIPYLDLRNDPKVPLMLGGRGGDIKLNPKARELRNKAFYVTASNGHPNLKAHEYQSTFIENWLRSL